MTWYPTATVRRYRLDGGSMVGGPSRIVLHTTETLGVPRYGDITGLNSAPHFTVHTDGSVYQHHDIDRAARALRNVAGGVQTNRQGVHCVQIEIVAYAKNGSNLPGPQLSALRSLIAWIRAQTGIPATWRTISRGSHCYGASSPCRMSPREWVDFEGICGHQEVSENSHWDPGVFDIGAIVEDDMAQFSDEEAETLRGMARAVKEHGSNGYGLVTETIELIRGLYATFRKLIGN